MQKQAFEKAIAVDHEKKSLTETLDVNSIGNVNTAAVMNIMQTLLPLCMGVLYTLPYTNNVRMR